MFCPVEETNQPLVQREKFGSHFSPKSFDTFQIRLSHGAGDGQFVEGRWRNSGRNSLREFPSFSMPPFFSVANAFPSHFNIQTTNIKQRIYKSIVMFSLKTTLSGFEYGSSVSEADVKCKYEKTDRPKFYRSVDFSYLHTLRQCFDIAIVFGRHWQ
jgi:hypothetical protein